MGKTYEALQRAEKELDEKLLEVSPKVPAVGATAPPKQVSTQPAVELYEALKTNILAHPANRSMRTILFAATNHNEGASSTAVNFATALTKHSRLKVLLIEVNFRTPSLHDVFKIEHAPGLSDVVASNGGKDSQVKKVGPGNLYVLTCGANHSSPMSLFDSNGFDKLLEATRKKFDFVVLDAPPMPSFPESLILGTKVDGVVLVIESGKTRRQVALRAKKQLEDSGGKLLGVVLNRKRYYIPAWIYKRL